MGAGPDDRGAVDRGTLDLAGRRDGGPLPRLAGRVSLSLMCA